MVYTTLLPNNEEVRFLPRSSSKNIRTLSVFSGILLLSGILFISLIETGPQSFYGYSVISLSIMLLLVSFSQSLSYKSFYSVGPNVILLKKGFSRRTIKIKNIVELKIVSEQEALNELMKLREEELQSRNDLDTLGSFRAQRRLGKFITYCTVPIAINEIKTSPNKIFRTQGLNKMVELVILKSKSGTRLLLSPQDSKGFVREIEKYRSAKNV